MTPLGPAIGPKTEGTCEYVLCGREAEMRVSAPPTVEPMLVCGLHVTPVLSWGVVLDACVDAPPLIEYLATRPEGRRGTLAEGYPHPHRDAA